MRWISEHWALFRDFLRRNRPYLVLVGLVVTFVAIFEEPRIVVIIHSGELGVQYKLFLQGTVTDHLYSEGIHLIWPWNTMFIYNTRIQASNESLSVLTNDGLQVTIDLSIRYHPESTMIGVLHQTVGPDYVHTIAIPEVESAVRTSVSTMTIEQLYQGVHAGLQTQSSTSAAAATPNTAVVAAAAEEREDTTLIGAINKAVDQAAKKYVLIDDVIVTRIKVPDYVQAAIQKKLEQQQVAEAEQFRVQQSVLEIQVAANEATRNNTLSKSLTPELLRLRGIEATEKLAASPNAKVVVVGNGANSLPVILGNNP